MAAAATSLTSRVSRCAVCKIDRKGRFVYLDDETEKLLGLSQVELFAKPFADFLDPADHEVIDEITSQFNRYESFYDAAPVTIIDSHGRRIAATVVVSLNFAAGNPVNYEIIINVAGQPAPAESQPVQDDGSAAFLEFLKDARRPSDSPRAASAVVEALCAYTEARSVGLFETLGETPHLIASAGQAPLDENREADDPSETAEQPPHCFKTVLHFSEEEDYLLKVTFDEVWPEDRLSRARQRAGLATALLLKALPPSDDDKPVYTSADTFSIIDLLERMKIGAALFDSEGYLADHNEKLRLLLTLDSVTCLEDFAQRLADGGDAELSQHVHAYFETSNSTEKPPSLELTVKLLSGQAARLIIFRLAPGTEDQSAYCILSPIERRQAHEPLPLSRRFIREAIERLHSSVSAGLSVFRKLDHEYRNQLERDGSFQLNCLDNHLRKTKSVLNKLSQAARFALEPEPPSLTDLELLTDQIMAEVVQAYPQVKLTLNKTSLPRITVCQKKLGTVLRNIFTHLVANAAGSKVGINIGATVNAKECHLRIKCEGASIPLKHLDHAFDPAGLGVTRELVATMGGQLELVKSHGKGSVLAVSLPTSEA